MPFIWRLTALFLRFDRAAIEFQPVTGQLIAEASGHFCLQPLDVIRAELYDFVGRNVDQMIVMPLGYPLDTGAAAVEAMPLNQAVLREQL